MLGTRNYILAILHLLHKSRFTGGIRKALSVKQTCLTNGTDDQNTNQDPGHYSLDLFRHFLPLEVCSSRSTTSNFKGVW